MSIHSFTEHKGFSILAEIHYDNSLGNAIANGRPVVAAYPSAPASLAIDTLADKLTTARGRP